jgi:hypothetical protein
MQVYWDRLAVVDAEPCPDAKRTSLPLVMAAVTDVGFSQRVLQAPGFSHYDYNHRPPLGDTRHPAGFYTAWGAADE